MLERGFEFAPGYRLQEFLGRGQFGQVWRASAPGGTAAAVKFIDLTEGSGQKEYSGIKRVKQIRQANLMPITAIWLLDAAGKVIDEPPEDATETMDISATGAQQTGMLVMPQVEPEWLVVAMLLGGQSLLHRLRECKQQGLPGIPPKELLSYMDDAAKGLDFLNEPRHDLGEGPVAIQHCDVKPANIVMIGTSAVVCDFGLARILTRNQITATSASGTPAYMAPEAIGGKPSRTSDQYSLAVTYYHLRTGSLPVKDGTLYEVLEAHRRGELSFEGISAPEQTVLRNATQLEWEKRFESNRDFVDALREALRSEGHTRTSFAADTLASATDLPETLDTPVQQDAHNDPTATIDTDFARPISPDEVETLAVNTEGQIAAPAKRTPNWFQQKYVIPVAIACVLAIVGIAMMQNGSDPKGKTPGTGNGTTMENLSAAELLKSAIDQFAADESKALDSFAAAISKDEPLPEVASRTIGFHSNAVERLLQTNDGSALVTIGYDKAPFVWNLNETNEVQQPQKLQSGDASILPEALALSPDGKRILCGSGLAAFVWTIDKQNTAATRITVTEHADEVVAVAWHPTNSQYAVTGSADGKLGIIELTAPNASAPHGAVARVKLLEIASPPKYLSFDPSGQFLVMITNQTPSHLGDVMAFRWDDLVVRFDDNSAPQPVSVKPRLTQALCINFVETDDEVFVAEGSFKGSVSLWPLNQDVKTYAYYPEHAGSVETMAVAHTDTGDVLASAASGGTIGMLPIEQPEKRKMFRTGNTSAGAIDISADGRWIAAGCDDGTVWLWDHDAEKAAQFQTTANTVDSVRIDSQGRWLIAGCGDGSIRLWDLVHCKLVALSTTVIDVESKPKQPTAETQASL